MGNQLFPNIRFQAMDTRDNFHAVLLFLICHADEQNTLPGSLFQEHTFYSLLTSLLHQGILTLTKSSDDNVVCSVYHLITFIIPEHTTLSSEIGRAHV